MPRPIPQILSYISQQDYGDFILELELKIEDLSSNSGVMARGQYDSAARNGKGFVFGYQIEADLNPRARSGGLYDEANGWRLLFNGVNTDNWKVACKAEYPSEGWIVVHPNNLI